ncbi:hypothetical protein HQN87_08210 [Paenibacillus tritici]|uniref:Uncharacterized protein n=1 Tax=Paenibacillus tritici TaxID=1873425 RepID=A0ABX2DKZ7_9BACL|nr:hypothetical protein [Paenibacillus tritici]NQX45313.1 hypothetical protein [Paenibacillus tritici]
MDFQTETAKFLAQVTLSVKTEHDLAELLAYLSAGIGALLFINLKKEGHAEMIDFMSADIKRSAANAAKDPGLRLMQLMKGVERGVE